MFKRATLAVKLMLAFLAVVALAMGAIAALVDRSAAQHFEDYVSVSARPRLAASLPALADHYARTGSWAGVDALLEAEFARGKGHGGQAEDGRGLQPVLADAEGRVVYDGSGRDVGNVLGSADLRRAQPIRVGAEVVGYLLAARGAREQGFIDSLGRSILGWGLIAGVVALLLGALLARRMVKPIRQLRDAARRVGSGELDYRLSVSSGDEIGELGAQFNQMAAALQEDEQLRQRMMADIAHELRTPLAVMRGQVEALLDGVFELTRENILPLHDAVLLLGRLVDDLRDLALADAGRLPLEADEVRIDALISRVTSAYEHAASDKGLSLHVELAEPLPPVLGDAQRLEQVLGNLLSNALRYTPAGARVVVRGWCDEDGLGFSVEDNGPGISPEDLPHIFERFYRADQARARAAGGSGLGLSIAKRLVEAHGGELTVRSELEVGSTFAVRLPKAPQNRPY